MIADTIFALSSGALPSGVAIIRMSGPAAGKVLAELTGSLPPERLATLATVRNSEGLVLDRAVVLHFPSPASFTGEDVVELHLHGGRATVKALLTELASRPGLRHAEAGEFTRRAFVNGKMDLTEVEGFADLLAAETEMQRRIALVNASGTLRKLHENWRRRLIKIRALIEADLDFPDEDDVPGSVADAARLEAQQLKVELQEHLKDFRRAEMVRDGLDVVIVGAPNAGKSSLLNALASREAAIVTDEAGTTRDLIEIVLDVEGHKIRITDTAGIRTTDSRVENIGIQRAIERARLADVVLHLSEDGDFDLSNDGMSGLSVTRILTKVDEDRPTGLPRGADLTISIDRPETVRKLVDFLKSRADLVLNSGRDIIPLRARQRDLMADAIVQIDAALSSWRELEIAGEHLRRAGDCLSHVTGMIGTEHLLDAIFREFCIGK